MSLSVIRHGRSRKLLKTTAADFAVSAFCLLFAKVYDVYGHGVHSGFMTYMFLYPLFGGALPFLFLWFFVPRAEAVRQYRFSHNCYHSGLAALTVGSTLDGIFEIAGTSSPYTVAFFLCGWSMAGAGLAVYVIGLITCARKRKVRPLTESTIRKT